MSAFSHFSHRNFTARMNNCSCGFATRHVLMFERHMKRCLNNRSGTSSVGQLPESHSGTMPRPLPAPTVCRNYKCGKCSFVSNQAKVFLFHQRHDHGENIAVYGCDKCEYASRHKNKVIRHKKLVHKIVSLPDDILALEDPSPFQASASCAAADAGEHVMEDADDSEHEGPLVIADVDQSPEEKLEPGNKSACHSGEGGNSVDGVSKLKQPVAARFNGSLPTNLLSTGLGMMTSTPKLSLLKLNNSKVVFRCKFCRYSNPHKWKIASHMRTSHSKKTIFKCPVCTFVTERKIDWCAHKSTHSGKMIFSCAECAYQTTMKRNYERHQERHLVNGPRRCSLCTYSSTGEGAIQRHMAEYHPPSPGKGIVHEDKNVKCAAEDYKVVPEDRMVESSSNCSFGSTTTVCSSFPAINSDFDVKLINSSSSTTIQPEGPAQDVQCLTCGLLFKSESKLRVHLIAHSSTSVWTCSLCPLRYKRPADLNRHMKRKHGATLVKNGKNALTPVPIQPDEQPLNLSLKTSPSSFEPALLLPDPPIMAGFQDLPLDLSTKCRPRITNSIIFSNFKCTHCSYMSKRQSDLRRHMLVHCNEKRYRCLDCGKGYKLQFDLNRHMNRVHRQGQATAAHFSSTSPVFYGPTAASPEQFVGNSNLVVALQKVDTRRNSDLQCGTQAYDSDRSLNGISIPSIPSPLRQMDMELSAVVGCHSQPQVENLDIKHQDVKKSLNLIGFKCKLCLYVGNSLQDLDLHTKLHAIEKPTCCHFCSYVAPKKNNMKHHLVTQHGREIQSESNLRELMDRIYNSDDGNAKESSDDDSDVAENLQLRFDNCVDYNMNVEMGSNTTRHGKETNPFVSDAGKSLERTAKSTRCTQCSFVCDAPSKMRCHMEIHENLRRFMCTHCGKRSNFLSDIRKHMKKKHPGVELTIQELSEEEAKQTLPDYKRSQLLESCSSTKVSPNIKDMSSIAGQTFQKEEPMDMESIAEQYANEVTAMFYGNLSSGGRVDMDEMSSRSASQSGYSESIDSKLPDDKKFGRPSRASLTNRYRPFKCSECGRRSNWRWDLNKHIRASHPTAHLIQLSEEVARATFSEVLKRDNKEWRSPELEQQHDEPTWKYKLFMCDSCGHRSNWKCDVTKHIKALHPAAHVIMMNEEHAKDTLAEYDEKHAKLLKLEGTREKMMIEDAGARRASDRASHTVDAHKTKKFKCSACPYRSNFRSDVGRHIRHKHDKNACKIVVMPELEAAATLTEYMDTWARKKFVPSPSKRRHLGLLASPPGEKEAIGSSTISSSNKPSGRRLWKCSSCSYKDLSKDAIVQHWQQQHQSEKDTEPAVAETECVEMNDEESAAIREMGSSIIGGIELPSIENIQDQTFSLIRNQSLNSNSSPAKQLLCSKCPYQTNTVELLNIHTSYHTPQAGNKYKCRHCPYYVCAPRLLNQHVLLHIKDLKVDTTDHSNLVSGSSENQLISAGSRNNGTGRTTYLCARCPYVSCNRNDYLYHRQFHRSRPCAPFKCDHCQYWVSQKRLLSQHAKVHERKYQEKHMRYTITDRKIAGLAPTTEDDDMKVAENMEMGPGGDAPEISSETCHVEDFNTNPEDDSESDAQTRDTDVDMEIAPDENESCDSRKESKKYFCNRCLFVASSQANLASHMLLHDIPQKYACRLCDYSTHNQQLYTQHKKLHQSSKSPKPEEESTRLNRDGTVVMVESLYDDVKKTYTCDRCPYSNARKDHLQCHMRFHLVKSELQCQYCDYSVSRVHLLNQHTKIHGVDVKSSKTPVGSPQESPRRPSKSSHLVSTQSGHQINSSSDLAEIQESFDGTFDECALDGEHNLKEIFMQNLNLRSNNQSHNCDPPHHNSASCIPPEMISNDATGFASISNLIHHVA